MANHTIVGSFEIAAPIPQASGNEIVVDIAFAGPLPAWWGFKNAGSCRTTSMSMNTTLSPVAVNCMDWASGQSTGGIAAYAVNAFFDPSIVRLVAASAAPASALADLFPGQEYFSFNLVINSQKTVGTGSCAAA